MPRIVNARKGDVTGTTNTATDRGVGPSVTVAKASYDPGYSLDKTLGANYSEADLRYGYTDRGYGVGK